MTIENSAPKPRQYFSPCPEDRSLQAYKSWILDIAQAVGATEDLTDTEQTWTSAWRGFWQKFDSSVPNHEEK